jgi:hypothetical protein
MINGRDLWPLSRFSHKVKVYRDKGYFSFVALDIEVPNTDMQAAQNLAALLVLRWSHMFAQVLHYPSRAGQVEPFNSTA